MSHTFCWSNEKSSMHCHLKRAKMRLSDILTRQKLKVGVTSYPCQSKEEGRPHTIQCPTEGGGRGL